MIRIFLECIYLQSRTLDLADMKLIPKEVPVASAYPSVNAGSQFCQECVLRTFRMEYLLFHLEIHIVAEILQKGKKWISVISNLLLFYSNYTRSSVTLTTWQLSL